MSETNNFRINLLTKNLVTHLGEILSERDDKDYSENLLDE